MTNTTEFAYLHDADKSRIMARFQLEGFTPESLAALCQEARNLGQEFQIINLLEGRTLDYLKDHRQADIPVSAWHFHQQRHLANQRWPEEQRSRLMQTRQLYNYSVAAPGSALPQVPDSETARLNAASLPASRLKEARSLFGLCTSDGELVEMYIRHISLQPNTTCVLRNVARPMEADSRFDHRKLKLKDLARAFHLCATYSDGSSERNFRNRLPDVLLTGKRTPK